MSKSWIFSGLPCLGVFLAGVLAVLKAGSVEIEPRVGIMEALACKSTVYEVKWEMSARISQVVRDK